MEKNTEARYLKKVRGKEVKYEVLKGDLWVSGWDERLCDTTQKLPDGEYVITYVPVGVNTGGDGIRKIKVFKLIEGDW